jgi:nucleoside-diphosphate-sugar epimerase
MRVLVTGATGFIGRRLVARLVKEGYTVTALVRKTSIVNGLPKGIRLAKGDMLDEASLKKAVAGNDAVIHLAANFDFYANDVDLQYRVNVEGTKTLITAAAAARVKRFIYCSTSEVIGPVETPPGNEKTDLRPVYDYGKSKVLAEAAVREVSDRTGIEHVILRPVGVMGGGDSYVGFETIKSINDHEIPVIPGDGEKHIMFIHVDDVVTGFLAALKSRTAANNTFILCTDDALNYNEVFETIADHLGVKPPKRKVPAWLAKIGIGVISPFKRRGKKSYLWHVKSVQAMIEDRWYSNKKAKKLLGWSPKLTMREGIRKAIDEHLAEGRLERKHADD